jgi:hypothetical protein
MGSRISAGGWAGIILSFIAVLSVNSLALILPLKIGLNRLKQREI